MVGLEDAPIQSWYNFGLCEISRVILHFADALVALSDFHYCLVDSQVMTDPVKHTLAGVPVMEMLDDVGLKKVSALPLINKMLVKDIAVPIRLIGYVIYQVQNL